MGTPVWGGLLLAILPPPGAGQPGCARSVPGHRQGGGDGGAVAGAGADPPAAPGHLDLLAHAGQAEVVTPELLAEGVGRLGGGEADPVVADPQPHPALFG